MKVVIVEDEMAASKRLSKMLVEVLPSVEVVEVLDSVEASVQWFTENFHPDLVFMDIQLADGISFEIFKEVEIQCPVIFTTAYSEYALDAFKVNSIDYLLKPVKQEELAKGMQKFHKLANPRPKVDYKELLNTIKSHQKEYVKRFIIKIRQSIRKVDVSEVAYFFTENKIVFLCTFENKRYPLDFSLDKLENQLDPEKFFRINRQFIVSMDAIKEMLAYSKSRVKLNLMPGFDGGDTIVSTERSPYFKKWIAGRI